MQRPASKPLSLTQAIRLRLASATPNGSTAEVKTEKDGDSGIRLGTFTRATEVTKPRKPSARERLDYWSNLRIHSDEVNFTPSTSHGMGGKAKVMQATLERVGAWNEEVAVKKLQYHRGMIIQKFSNEFVHEVEILAGLSHRSIVRLIGFVEDLEQGEAWIVLSWHPNGNVSEFLATGEWEIPERVSLIQDTLSGLGYLHSRKPPICHGDLKSLNILVSSSYRAIITDFGSARVLTDLEDRVGGEDRDRKAEGNSTAEVACPKIQVGAAGSQLTLTGPSWSLRWAPPEVVNGDRGGLPGDIWSAGWVCWEIMTNKVPFPELEGAGLITLTVIQGKVPLTREDAQLSQIIGLCSLMTDCWAFDPKNRPSIIQCRNEVGWMPAAVPSRIKAPSIKLSLETGRLHFSQGRHESAASLYRQALSVARLGGKIKGCVEALAQLGYISFSQSKYSDAESFFTRAHEFSARMGDCPSRANTLQELGKFYYARSKYSKAEESFNRALKIYDRIGDKRGRASTLQGLGKLYSTQSKYFKAEDSFIQARQIYAGIRDKLGGAETVRGLGKLYYVQAKYSEAEESFIRAREIYARIGHELGRANTLQGMGELYYLQSRHREAEEFFTEAREISARIGDGPSQAETLQGLGKLYYNQSKYSEAEESFVQAREIYDRIGDELGQANALQELEALYRAQFRYSEAEEAFIRVQEIHSSISNDQDRSNK